MQLFLHASIFACNYFCIAIIFASGFEALSLVLDIAAGGFGWLGEEGSADFGHDFFAIIFACNYLCIACIFASSLEALSLGHRGRWFGVAWGGEV